MASTFARFHGLPALALFLFAPLASAQITQRWSVGETTPLAGADDQVTALAATAEGRMVFAVRSVSGTSQSTRVRCRDAAGALAWDTDPSPAGVHFEQAHTRRGGGAYFTGTWSSPTGSAPPRVVSTRIDESGTQLWTDQWAPPGFDASTDSVRSTVDDMGYLWVTGTFQVQLSNLLAPDPFAHVRGNEIFLQVWSRHRGDGSGHGTAAIRITVP